MKKPAAKLAFAHRVLWGRDPLYRVSLLLGPAPIFGCAVAAAIWLSIYAPPSAPGAPDATPPWARPVGFVPAPQDTQPYIEKPAAPLPQPGPHGDFPGLASGWQGAIEPMTINATMDANVIATDLTTFPLNQPTLPLASFLDVNPPSGLYAGVAKSFLVVRAPGRYAISLRLQRSAKQPANCMVRLGTAHHRVIRAINLNTGATADFTYPPTEFRFQPGLYFVAVAAACWRADQVTADTEITLMIRHPGELNLHPARADELVHPQRK